MYSHLKPSVVICLALVFCMGSNPIQIGWYSGVDASAVVYATASAARGHNANLNNL